MRLIRTTLTTAAAALALTAAPLRAQEHPSVQAAAEAFQNLDFEGAIRLARIAIDSAGLGVDDLVVAYELLGYAYGTLDSATQAVLAFQSAIQLDPNRRPDAERYEPRLVNLYNQAFGMVLVIRGLSVESASFVVGQGTAAIAFETSRPSTVTAHVRGAGVSVLVDSQVVNGAARWAWNALTAAGEPVPPGTYQVVVRAQEGNRDWEDAARITVRHAAVDTVPHLDRLESLQELPEYVTPPRDWRPLGVAVLYAGLSAGASVALENTTLGGARAQVLGISAAALVIGLWQTLKAPEPRLDPANVRYNAEVQRLLEERNADIARDNEARRQQTVITIVPATGTGG